MNGWFMLRFYMCWWTNVVSFCESLNLFWSTLKVFLNLVRTNLTLLISINFEVQFSILNIQFSLNWSINMQIHLLINNCYIDKNGSSTTFTLKNNDPRLLTSSETNVLFGEIVLSIFQPNIDFKVTRDRTIWS